MVVLEIFTVMSNQKSEYSKVSLKNSPYLVCNEQKQQDTLKLLANQASLGLKENHVHVGFSVWFNFDIICTTRPNYAAIFDCDPGVHGFIYPIFQSTIICATSREEFCSQFLKNLMKQDVFVAYEFLLADDFQLLQKRAYGFLANEDNFNYLKEMITQERVFFGRLDLTNLEQVSTIREWISKNNLILDTLYLSNIPEWIIQGNKHIWDTDIKGSISSLLQGSTQLIDAFYPTTKKDSSGPPQRLTQGTILPDYQVKVPPKLQRQDTNQGSQSRYKRQLFDASMQEYTIPNKRTVYLGEGVKEISKIESASNLPPEIVVPQYSF